MSTAISIRSLLLPFSGLRLAPGDSELQMSIVSGGFCLPGDEAGPSREDQVLELYDQLRPSLLTYLAALGLAPEQAEDVIHDCFLKLYDQLAQSHRRQNLRGWLFRVAHNLAMDLFRAGSRIQQQDADAPDPLEMILDASCSPEEHVIRKESIRRMRIALGRLTQQQRSAVLLRAEELRYREIAAVLGVSTKRVSELVQRALTRLAGEM